MPFPARLLADGEEVLSESNQHWIALRDEIAYSLVWIVLWIVFVPWLDFRGDEWIAWALTVAWLVLVGYGVAGWQSTELVVTNKRIIFRRGPFAKSAHEMEVDELKNVETRQSALQRLVGSGDLLFELGGGGGKTVVRDIPDPIHVSSVVADARDAHRSAGREGPAPVSRGRPPGPPHVAPGATGSKSRAEQLEILARLNAEGKLTDEEFAAEKARLLGSH